MQLACNKRHFLSGCCCAAQVNTLGVTQLAETINPADFADAEKAHRPGSAVTLTSNMARVVARLQFPSSTSALLQTIHVQYADLSYFI
jgi:hypothetical protein